MLGMLGWVTMSGKQNWAAWLGSWDKYVILGC